MSNICLGNAKGQQSRIRDETVAKQHPPKQQAETEGIGTNIKEEN